MIRAHPRPDQGLHQPPIAQEHLRIGLAPLDIFRRNRRIEVDADQAAL
jgi:hypothetical protein